jgi:hypothetical protein
MQLLFKFKSLLLKAKTKIEFSKFFICIPQLSFTCDLTWFGLINITLNVKRKTYVKTFIVLLNMVIDFIIRTYFRPLKK